MTAQRKPDHYASPMASVGRQLGPRRCFRTSALVVVGVMIAWTLALMPRAPEAQAFPENGIANEAIANLAMTYNGRWGGETCRDVGRSGYNGTTPGGQTHDGLCKAWLVCVVLMATGRWVGNDSISYQDSFPREGAIEVRPDEAQRGDIVMIGHSDASFPLHAAIIWDRLEGQRFYVIDSNFRPDEKVRFGTITIPTFESHIWRFGQVPSGRNPSISGTNGSILGPIGPGSVMPAPGSPINPQPYPSTGPPTVTTGPPPVVPPASTTTTAAPATTSPPPTEPPATTVPPTTATTVPATAAPTTPATTATTATTVTTTKTGGGSSGGGSTGGGSVTTTTKAGGGSSGGGSATAVTTTTKAGGSGSVTTTTKAGTGGGSSGGSSSGGSPAAGAITAGATRGGAAASSGAAPPSGSGSRAVGTQVEGLTIEAAPASVGGVLPTGNAPGNAAGTPTKFSTMGPVLITIRKVTYEAYASSAKTCRTGIMLYKRRAAKPYRCTTAAEAKAIKTSDRVLTSRLRP